MLLDLTQNHYAWRFTSDLAVRGLYINGTRDCWECCTAAAHDVFQVSTMATPPSGAPPWQQQWVNTTFVFNAAASTVTLTPVNRSATPYAVVRYGASLWPQCAIYSAANQVPAFTFSNLSITGSL